MIGRGWIAVACAVLTLVLAAPGAAAAEQAQLPDPTYQSVSKEVVIPMDDGVNLAATVTFPSRFTLAAALNPCPCGFYNDSRHECVCSPMQIAR